MDERDNRVRGVIASLEADWGIFMLACFLLISGNEH